MSPAGDTFPLIDWQDGQPVSRRFGDVYFSRDSGLEETRHVFLEGNGLRERWAALPLRDRFTIGETGFGTGLNFAAAWALWEEAAPAEARLRYVSVERDPLAPADIARTLALWPELARYREDLLAQWREVPPGWHRFVFAGGRVILTLLAGDVSATLPRLDGRFDAWFLDGFAPARNPEMWQPEVLAQVARLSASGATCATYTVAGEVRRGLEAAGFAVEKRPGFGRKREMLRGVLRTPPRAAWCAPWFTRPARYTHERRAIVIGAGLAGASTAASLAARGWRVTLLDRHETIAAEASGNPLGALYARLSPHATALTELATTGLEYTARSLPLLGLERGADFDPCGVLQLECDDAERVRQSRLAAQGWPAGFLTRLDRTEASARAGVAVPSGGLFFPRTGWARPSALCRALATQRDVQMALGRAAITLRRSSGGWEVHTGAGPVAAAPVVVIAASGGVGSVRRNRPSPAPLDPRPTHPGSGIARQPVAASGPVRRRLRRARDRRPPQPGGNPQVPRHLDRPDRRRARGKPREARGALAGALRSARRRAPGPRAPRRPSGATLLESRLPAAHRPGRRSDALRDRLRAARSRRDAGTRRSITVA